VAARVNDKKESFMFRRSLTLTSYRAMMMGMIDRSLIEPSTFQAWTDPRPKSSSREIPGVERRSTWKRSAR
jgi:hypothetical protein